MAERVPEGGRFTNDLPSESRLSGEQVRLLMRLYRVTIRQLSEEMGITQRRVRQVRQDGVEGYAYVRDWLEAISHGEIHWQEKNGQ